VSLLTPRGGVFVSSHNKIHDTHTANFMKWILLLLVNFNTNTKLPHTRVFPIKIKEILSAISFLDCGWDFGRGDSLEVNSL
jgi:hypothetical protein